MEQNDLLRYTIRSLEELEIAYMIEGSLASSAYGEPRLTNDIDIVADLQLEHIPGLMTKFPAGQFYLDEEAVRREVSRRGQFNIIHPTSGYKIDIFICGQYPFGRLELSRRHRLEAPDGEHAFFVSPEDVILKKMEYIHIGQSERQLRDILGMLRVQGKQIDETYIGLRASRMGLTEIWKSILQQV
ncbi:MAG TPA: hypothetical protein VI382_10760 [Candidatus Manganitrophaceae bacterium]|nr:hypothetical protein [Candidatus Manganitrophaceae bacterium]